MGKQFLKKFGSSYIRKEHGRGWKRRYFSNKIYFREEKNVVLLCALKKERKEAKANTSEK